eukprot:4253187-Amphidinium_carterae.2
MHTKLTGVMHVSATTNDLNLSFSDCASKESCDSAQSEAAVAMTCLTIGYGFTGLARLIGLWACRCAAVCHMRD